MRILGCNEVFPFRIMSDGAQGDNQVPTQKGGPLAECVCRSPKSWISWKMMKYSISHHLVWHFRAIFELRWIFFLVRENEKTFVLVMWGLFSNIHWETPVETPVGVSTNLIMPPWKTYQYKLMAIFWTDFEEIQRWNEIFLTRCLAFNVIFGRQKTWHQAVLPRVLQEGHWRTCRGWYCFQTIWVRYLWPEADILADLGKGFKNNVARISK